MEASQAGRALAMGRTTAGAMVIEVHTAGGRLWKQMSFFQTYKTAGSKEKTIFVLGVAVSLLPVCFNILTVLPSLWQNALHYSGFALLCCLTYPLSGSKQKPKWFLAVDLVLIGLASLILSMGLPVTWVPCPRQPSTA